MWQKFFSKRLKNERFMSIFQKLLHGRQPAWKTDVRQSLFYHSWHVLGGLVQRNHNLWRKHFSKRLKNGRFWSIFQKFLWGRRSAWKIDFGQSLFYHSRHVMGGLVQRNYDLWQKLKNLNATQIWWLWWRCVITG